MNIVRHILIIAIIVVPSLFGYAGATTEMGISVGAISIGLFFANLERFTRFKGAGLEAELRVAVTEAYAAVEDLKRLALVFSESAVSTLAALGPNDKPYIDARLKQISAIRNQLAELGVSKDEVERVSKPLYDSVEDMLKVRLIWPLCKIKENQTGGKRIFAPFGSSRKGWSAKTIRENIREQGMVTDAEVDSILQSLEYFESKRELPNFDGWAIEATEKKK